MKLSLWIYTAAVIVTVLVVFCLGGIFDNIFHDFFGNRPMPYITSCFLRFKGGAPSIAVPWLIVSGILSRGTSANPSRCLAFGACAILIIVILLGFTAISVACPFTYIDYFGETGR